MENLQYVEEETIDLGRASVETKGTALFDADISGDPRVYAAGVAEDCFRPGQTRGATGRFARIRFRQSHHERWGRRMLLVAC